MDQVYRTPDEFFAALDQQAAPHDNDALVSPGQRPCPICGKLMKTEGQFGVGIDACPEHGVWLDRGELEMIVRSAKAVPESIRWQVIEKARRDGKMKGALFGWWAFLVD
jgi:Zn-finger nucleic acid-binding protein